MLTKDELISQLTENQKKEIENLIQYKPLDKLHIGLYNCFTELINNNPGLETKDAISNAISALSVIVIPTPVVDDYEPEEPQEPEPFDSQSTPVIASTGSSLERLMSTDFSCVQTSKTPEDKIRDQLYEIKEIPKSPSEKLKITTDFVRKHLRLQPKHIAETIIDYDIKEHFNLTPKDCKTLIGFWKAESSMAKPVKGSKGDKDDKKENKKESSVKVPFDVVAERIVENHHIFTFDDTKEIYMYAPEAGIYVKEKVETSIKQMARSIYCDVYAEICSELGVEVPEHIATPGIAFCNEVLEHIRIQTHISRREVDKQQLDNIHLICVLNGVYNTETDTLQDHDPELRMIRQIPVRYDPNAKCPMVEKFLSEVVCPEEAKVLLEFMGYCLIPDIKNDQAIMLHGSGANGKSVFLKLFTTIMGIDNVCAVSLHRLCDDRFASAEFYSKLVNIYPDLGDSIIQSDEYFKLMTSGDMITGQIKFGQPFRFTNYARMIFSANKIPPAHDKAYAYMRRWIIISFPHTFEGKKKDKQLINKLTTPKELSGLFNLMLEGLERVQWFGEYSTSTTIAEISEQYALKSDPVKTFLDMHVDIGDDSIPKSVFYSIFAKWCASKHVEAPTHIQFAKRLKKMGFEESRPRDIYNNQISCWASISFKDLPENITESEKPEISQEDFLTEQKNSFNNFKDFGQKLSFSEFRGNFVQS